MMKYRRAELDAECVRSSVKSVKWMGDLFSLSDHSASQKQPVQARRKTRQIGRKEVQKAPQYWRPTIINKCEVPLTGGLLSFRVSSSFSEADSSSASVSNTDLLLLPALHPLP